MPTTTTKTRRDWSRLVAIRSRLVAIGPDDADDDDEDKARLVAIGRDSVRTMPTTTKTRRNRSRLVAIGPDDADNDDEDKGQDTKKPDS